MGFNIAGLIINKKIEREQELESFLENKLHYVKDVEFEDATSSSKDENTIDVLQTENGTLIITEMGQIYDLTNIQSEVVQFIVSDVSDTYYFEKYSNGNLDRKFISSQGEIAEDIGEGILNEDDDLMDKIWEFADDYLQNKFTENMFDLKFKRYEFST
ncbi:hypothetical protein ABIB40_004159 [Pedobacter sp. UYP30]|uniref:hypothetical protein n=1 Tax=Pedobacter sp. UYP30 TaxID=1756400 RepID=UPI0033932DF0